MAISEDFKEAELNVMDADGSHVTRLTSFDMDDDVLFLFGDWFAWSPDGTKIAFASLDIDDETADIYVINPDGSAQMNLTRNAVIQLYPQWSPDGTQLVFVSADEDTELVDLYLINADGSGQMNLTNNSSGERLYQPQWSPDGTKIAFILFDEFFGTSSDIYTMNLDGSAQINLTDDLRGQFHLRWSPDGTKLAFLTLDEVTESFDIYVMHADGSGQTRLTENIFLSGTEEIELLASGGAGLFAWSPDGAQIAFVSDRDDNIDIYVMNADGSGQTRLTSDHTIDIFPAWAPDGARLIFLAFDEDEEVADIYQIKPDGSGQISLTHSAGEILFAPAWRP